MKDVFFMGGLLFMSILTILLIGMVSWIVYHFLYSYFSKNVLKEKVLRKMQYGKSIGLFAMITGILGQLVGLYSAFSTMAEVGDISPAIVYSGLKVSMIPTLYGMLIYLLSIILWFIASILLEKKLD